MGRTKVSKRCVALLGEKDSPTDAVEDYCRYLAAALPEHGIQLDISRLAWAEKGWKAALADLRTAASSSSNTWFLIQYTALAWSRRGFPWRVLRAIGLLKQCGGRVAVVFHDIEPYHGRRMVDRVRSGVQLRTMQNILRLSDVSIFTVAVEQVPWIGRANEKTVFIPVGANLPDPERAWAKRDGESERPPCVGVFSISGGEVAAAEEVSLIADCVSYVSEKLGAIRLAVIGRNSATAGPMLREKLRGKTVEVVAYGMLSGEKIVDALGACEALLFARWNISTRRGSAIAGIACGLPVIAREGWETAPPITEAGVVLLPAEAAAREFGPALLRVLEDRAHREELAAKSRNAQRQHFSWKAIAAKYAEILEEKGS